MREVPLAFTALHLSAREGCPGHRDTLFIGRISSRLVRPSSYKVRTRQRLYTCYFGFHPAVSRRFDSLSLFKRLSEIVCTISDG